LIRYFFLPVAVLAAILACSGEGELDPDAPIDPRSFHAAYPTCFPSGSGGVVPDAGAAEELLGWRPLLADASYQPGAMTVTENCDRSLGLIVLYVHTSSDATFVVLQGSGTTTPEVAPTGVPMQVGERFVQWLEGPPEETVGVFKFGEHDGGGLYATVIGGERRGVEELIDSLH
jgi:hypothetical protein